LTKNIRGLKMVNNKTILRAKDYKKLSSQALSFMIMDRINFMMIGVQINKCKKQIEKIQNELNRRNAV
jgi:hypothetical protein